MSVHETLETDPIPFDPRHLSCGYKTSRPFGSCGDWNHADPSTAYRRAKTRTHLKISRRAFQSPRSVASQVRYPNQKKIALVMMKANPVIGNSSERRIFDARLRLSEIVYPVRPMSRINAATASTIQTIANTHRTKIMRDIGIPHAAFILTLDMTTLCLRKLAISSSIINPSLKPIRMPATATC
ncbi:hypothetical protein SAMN05444171_1186 [Bradyrhizobium lablabi]|uniref:Uncharacterized protein n=2 Tax=Bradyrhizobium TaxID=374 RepID=A0ABY0Q6Z4_9BRAD|nr:hypothetical protein SAMN05444163_5973 [Bradyrhizobium ottawaense]SEC34219.1 hypothetical protein SAMN05444171_1186 [Bradyrhizobium lablabi]